MPHVCDYIARQREHHAANDAIVRWEERVLARTRAVGEDDGIGWDGDWEDKDEEEADGMAHPPDTAG